MINILIQRIKLLLKGKNGFREFAYLIGERESNNNYQAKKFIRIPWSISIWNGQIV